MSRFVVDASALLHLLKSGAEVSDEHQLLAPTLVRSEILAELYSAAGRGEIPKDEARRLLERLGRMKIRFLGDAVLRRVAWDIAESLGWDSTLQAEYVALTRLQADALVTMDDDFARSISDVVETASIDDLA